MAISNDTGCGAEQFNEAGQCANDVGYKIKQSNNCTQHGNEPPAGDNQYKLEQPSGGTKDRDNDPPESCIDTPASSVVSSTVSYNTSKGARSMSHKQKPPISPPNKNKMAHKFLRTAYRQVWPNDKEETYRNSGNGYNSSKTHPNAYNAISAACSSFGSLGDYQGCSL